MMDKKFSDVGASPENPQWERLVRRQNELYKRSDDVRSEFARDYTRILHSYAYRRLKHKTQVFFNIENDHICTRMEHVLHVESVSSTIANSLGLNAELTKAIAMGHDLGHAPFGHHGERVLDEIAQKYLGDAFWHEKNGLRRVDSLELLEDNYRVKRNLDLTYAVRDGIISHCGEIDENALRPRSELLDLSEISKPNEYAPATWEACAVKIADKIAYVGRDIEDAIKLGFLSDEAKAALERMAREHDNAINTTVIMHNMIIDICENSSPEKGILLSERYAQQLNEIKKFNYETIYKNSKFEPFQKYAELIINQLFRILFECYAGEYTLVSLNKKAADYPDFIKSFSKWLSVYCANDIPESANKEPALYENEKCFGYLQTQEIYAQAILDYISGMTDRYAIMLFNELITY